MLLRKAVIKIFFYSKKTCAIIYAGGKNMEIEKAVKALQQIKTYCSATQLDELEFTISVLEKLQKDGITDPLNTDFSTLKK